MSAGWVAAATRGRALRRRLVGSDGARAIAATPSWPDARRALAPSFYGTGLPARSDRRNVARHATNASAWQLRVLAGWLPPGRSVLARLFAAPMEIANIEGRLTRLAGGDALPPAQLGSLAVAWPRVNAARSPEQIRAVLAASVWGDPGGVDRPTVALGLRIAWARRLAHLAPETAAWAKGAAAVLVARERFAFGRPVGEPTGRVVDGLLGRGWREASDLPSLVERLPAPASWPVVDVVDPSDLWRSEIAVGRRVADDADRHVTAAGHDRTAVTSLMALLLVDLRRVLAAIELAGRAPNAGEVFDAVA